MNGWAIFGVIAFLIILALAIVFLILWLTKGGKANSKKELAINGLNVLLSSGVNIPVAPLPTPIPMPPMQMSDVSSNTFMTLNPISLPTTPFGVTATWQSVGNNKDKVTMYADTKPIDLDADGKPEPSKNPKVRTSGPVDGNVRTASIPNLAAISKTNFSS